MLHSKKELWVFRVWLSIALLSWKIPQVFQPAPRYNLRSGLQDLWVWRGTASARSCIYLWIPIIHLVSNSKHRPGLQCQRHVPPGSGDQMQPGALRQCSMSNKWIDVFKFYIWLRTSWKRKHVHDQISWWLENWYLLAPLLFNGAEQLWKTTTQVMTPQLWRGPTFKNPTCFVCRWVFSLFTTLIIQHPAWMSRRANHFPPLWDSAWKIVGPGTYFWRWWAP